MLCHTHTLAETKAAKSFRICTYMWTWRQKRAIPNTQWYTYAKLKAAKRIPTFHFFFFFVPSSSWQQKNQKFSPCGENNFRFFFFFFFRVRPAEWKKKNCNFKRVTNFSTHRNRRVHQRKIILIPQSLQSRRQLAPQRMHRGLQLVQCDLQLYKRDPCRKTIAIKRTFEKKKICGFFFFYLCFFVFVFFFVFFGWWLLKLFYFSWERYEKKNYCNLRAFII